MDNIQITKRGGGSEDWSYDKLVSSMAKAGLDLQKAEELAKRVESWAVENVESGQLSSNQIRDRVYEVLMKEDPMAADSYRAYKKA